MRAAVVAIGALAVLASSCGALRTKRAAPPSEPRPVALAPANGSGTVIADYTLHYDHPSGEIAVDVRTRMATGASFGVDNGAEEFVLGAEAKPLASGSKDAAFSPITRRDRVFTAPDCAQGPCRIRYRIALKEAARKIDDLNVATSEGDAIEAPPFTWLLAPNEPPADARLRFRVTCSEGMRFATGVFRARDAPDAWEIALEDLYTSPYSVFGPLRLRTVQAAGAAVEIAITPGKLALDDEQIAAWISDAARAVTTYLGRYPMPSALIVLVPSDGRSIGGGRTLAGGGGTVFMRLGESAPMTAYKDDWVIVHEMTHLVIPSLPREQNWAEEGLATYVEPFARVRAGLMTEESAWRGLARGLPNGLPGASDRGLDHTPTWGRTYWGGALFWFLADVEIRKQTKNAKGLEHALRAIVDAGMNNAIRRPIDEVFDVGDKATGTRVLRELHDQMGASPHPVDLKALFASLGVEATRGGVTFDDKAPLAHVRKAITKDAWRKAP